MALLACDNLIWSLIPSFLPEVCEFLVHFPLLIHFVIYGWEKASIFKPVSLLLLFGMGVELVIMSDLFKVVFVNTVELFT